MQIKNLNILLYHRICADNEYHPGGSFVSKSVFHSQMEYLAQHYYYTPRFSDMLEHGFEKNGTAKTPVIITFDDGYRDNYENALPILQEFGFTAMMFLVTDFSRNRNWWDNMPFLQAPLVNPSQIREMQAAGIEMASHTMSHHSMVTLNDYRLREEFVSSKKALEDVIQRSVSFVAYPYGDIDIRVKRAAQEAGYSCAFAGSTGPLDAQSDLYEIRRVTTENRSSESYMFWLASGLAKSYQCGKGLMKKMLGLRNRYHHELPGIAFSTCICISSMSEWVQLVAA